MFLALGIDTIILGIILYCFYAAADSLGYVNEAKLMMLLSLVFFLISPWLIVAGTVGL